MRIPEKEELPMKRFLILIAALVLVLMVALALPIGGQNF